MGMVGRVFSAFSHYHHDPSVLSCHWNGLCRFVSRLPHALPIFMLADCNLVHLLDIDTTFPLIAAPECQMAWAKEVQVLQALDLANAWFDVHSSLVSLFSDSEPVPGYTFCFGHSNAHLRRLDPVHVPAPLPSWVSECYSFFLGGAHHKAVCVDISPPEGSSAIPTFSLV